MAAACKHLSVAKEWEQVLVDHMIIKQQVAIYAVVSQQRSSIRM